MAELTKPKTEWEAPKHDENLAPAAKILPVETNPLDEVVQDISGLTTAITRALASGNLEVMVTEGVLRALLLNKYKGDRYIVYNNVTLYDHLKYEEAIEIDNETINQRIFGRSKSELLGVEM